ncbi:MAG: CCA tRNA nucleotidyltransferase, partial [Chloroflexi bacterium]|nr:CCA tRNA nucleotidyltransferase [Chloroflexota bacterium]
MSLAFVQDDHLKRILDLLRSQPLPCYVAGGYVREWLLGQPGKDVDIVVAGAAIPLARRIANRTGGAFSVLDEETEAARIVDRAPSELTVDLAAMRGGDIVADLQMRDFTVNAMAVDVRDYEVLQPPVIDPCGGQADLAAHILRATNENAFRQDAVRLLRAVRFVATLGLRIEPQTEAWIRRDAPLITQPSAERIRQELALIVAAPDAAQSLRKMDELGLLPGILPEVAALKGVAQSAPHIYDVYEHTLATVAEAERLSAWPDASLWPEEEEFLSPFAPDLAAHFQPVLCEGRTRATLFKFAALCHDLGKPRTVTVEEDGRIRNLGHENVGAEMTREMLTRLKFSAKEIRLVSTIVKHHMRPSWLVKQPAITRKAIYHFFRDMGDAGVDVLMLVLADQLATRGEALRTAYREHWLNYLRLVHLLLDHYFHKPAEA